MHVLNFSQNPDGWLLSEQQVVGKTHLSAGTVGNRIKDFSSLFIMDFCQIF